MIVQSTSALFFPAAVTRSPLPRHNPGELTANSADTVRISQAARDAYAASASSSAAYDDKSVEARLASIRAKGGVNVTQEEHDFLFANDKRLAEIIARDNASGGLTADEIDYMQKATGMVNTFANLSPAEKALYDKAVASGNTQAAAGIGLIAFTRMMGHTAGGADDTTYDPLNTAINAANIEKFFRHSIVDPTGRTQSQFQALIQFLEENPVV